MQDIVILTESLAPAAALADLLVRRRVTAALAETAEGAAACCLVISAAHEAAVGRAQIVETARRIGAKRLVVIATDDAQTAPLHVATELSGRLVRATLARRRITEDPLQDTALLAVADLIAEGAHGMVAADAETGRLIDLARRVGESEVTVFVAGPNGTGKEVLARLIHDVSPRAGGPFVAINCAAIPENMLEATLFGHEKGAFTGAAAASKGLIRAAEGGTLLLDEVSEMPLGLQAKILRVLQERRVTPLGAQTEQPVDVRVIATSNRDMREAVRAGTFREDLYYRLNVFPLATRALAERPDDVPALAAALIRRHCRDAAGLPELDPRAMARLLEHDWPGNVRELENVVQRALVLRDGHRITAEDIMLPDDAMALAPPAAPAAAAATALQAA